MSKPSHLFSLTTLRARAEEERAGLPALIAAARTAARTVQSGGHARRRAGSGENFWQFRDYHPGDRPQAIDWRQSGKGDRIFVRERERQTAQTALFWCAGGPGMHWRSSTSLPTKHEAASVFSLALALLMEEADERVGPLDGSARANTGEAAIETLGQNLLGATSVLPPESMTATTGAQIILAGDFLAPLADIDATLDRLAPRAGGGLVLQVLDPAELTLPYEGRVIFETIGGADRYPAEQVSALRAAYTTRLQAHLDAVAALCARRHWHYQLHRTDRPVRETLMQVWEAMTHVR